MEPSSTSQPEKSSQHTWSRSCLFSFYTITALAFLGFIAKKVSLLNQAQKSIPNTSCDIEAL